MLKDINKVENIQRRYTKFAFQKCSIPFSSYEDRLNKVGLLKLQDRRKYFDMILLYKIFHGISDLSFHDYFIFIPAKYSPRFHSFKIINKHKFSSQQGQNSIFIRAPLIWNKLPESIVSAKTIYIFKRLLKQHFSTPIEHS